MSRKRWIWVGVAVAAVALIGGGAWASRGQIAYAQVATTYAAKTTCSCLRVSGRTMDSCIADFPAEARENIEMTEDGDAVRASVLLGAISAEAVYEDGFGCRIVTN